MKKNVYALLGALVLFATLPVCAEKLSFEKAFAKLVVKCNDFKSLYATGEPRGYEYPTTLDVDKAQRCYIRKMAYEVAFVAEFGTFDTQRKAEDCVKSLETSFKAANSSFRFSSGYHAKMRAVVDYFCDYTSTGFNRYGACFKQVKIGSNYQVVFEFIQSAKNAPAFLEFTFITAKDDDTEFGRSFTSILEKAAESFVSIKGDYVEERDLKKYYKATLNPAGFSDCFLEQAGDNAFRYVMDLCHGVSKSKLDETLKDILDRLYLAFGTNYAVAFDNAQKKYLFVKKENPDRDVADLVTRQSRQDYSLTLYIQPVE